MAVVLLQGLTAGPAAAQFLRLGPFDFSAKLQSGLVYSDNVERERPSESTSDREDYYAVAGISLNALAPISHSTEINFDTGMTIEKHFVRDDLDNSSSPLAHIGLASRTEMGYLDLTAEANWERSSSSADDVVIPGGRSSKTRNPNDSWDWTVGGEWERGDFSMSLEYGESSDRYEKEEFQDGDQDEKTWEYEAEWRARDDLSLAYRQSRTKTILKNSDAPSPGWKTTESITVDYLLEILKRPALVYTFGLEKEDTDEEKGEWEPTHEISLVDDLVLVQRPLITVGASYRYEKDPEDDDISFIYNAGIEHEINRVTRHSLTMEREPKKTFGSSQESDSTTWAYSLERDDILVPALDALFTAQYAIDKPPSGPEERTWTYQFGLSHNRPVTKRLTRSIRYEYYLETSNLEDEDLEENRIEWLYEYEL